MEIKFKNFFVKLIATVFGVGYTPFFPGTAGSLFGLFLVYFLPEISVVYSLIILTILFFIGVWSGGEVARINQKHDPSIVVIDEVLGMWVSLLLLPKIIWLYGLSFVIFRFFDISKIFPINRMEDFDSGWGIMLDDLVAGIFTFFIVQLITFLVIQS